MARAAPQSHPYNRQSSTSSRNFRQTSSSSSASTQQTAPASNRTSDRHDDAGGGGRRMLTSASILPSLLMIPLVLLHFAYSIVKGILLLPFRAFLYKLRSARGEESSARTTVNNNNNNDDSQTGGSNSGDDTINMEELLRSKQQRIKSQSPDGGVDDEDYLSVPASPALTTLLDDALYRAYQPELVPTVAAASRLLAEFLEVKEASALVWRECRWAVGVPMDGGLEVAMLRGGADADEAGGGADSRSAGLAVGAVRNGVLLGPGALLDGRTGRPIAGDANDQPGPSSAAGGGVHANSGERMHAEEMGRWNEYDTAQDFARQCYLLANEAIQRLSTDRLAETANLSLQDSIRASIGTKKGGEQQPGGQGAGGGTGGGAQSVTPSPPPLPNSGSSGSSSSGMSAPSLATLPACSPLNSEDMGIGRCYSPQPRRDCWESPRLYCPDYYWADDAIGGCQRLLKTLSKHRFVSLVGTNGWDRYFAGPELDRVRRKRSGGGGVEVLQTSAAFLGPPARASQTPHVFPSLEAVHALQYLVSHLLSHSVPARLNQFRAAVEANAVVSKRLYLVKCEYRAPMRALWESYGNLRAAPRAGLVERYLREFHGVVVKKQGKKDDDDAAAGESGASSGGRSASGSMRSRKGSSGGDVAKKSAIQQQREKLEKLITEKYWKHPAFVEALQLERCCERMEVEMSQMLLPLSNLAYEIMTEWKGRLRAVAVINNPGRNEDDSEDDEEEGGSEVDDDPVTIMLGWREVPFMRELLRRLKSILRRKPDLDESTGIRPLLLDLQGVHRHKRDPIDSSIEMPFYPPPNDKSSLFGRFTTSSEKNASTDDDDDDQQWFHLEQFLSQVRKLLELLALPGVPFLVEERPVGSKGGSREYNKNTLSNIIEQCEEVWDEEMFRAQYKDWFDMVKRQQELNAGGGAAADSGDADDGSGDEHPTSLSELSETIRDAEIELSIASASRDQLERVRKRLEALRADKVARYKVLAQIVFDVGYRELNDGVVVESPEEDEEDDDDDGHARRNAVEFPRLAGVVPGVFGDQLAMSGEELPVG